MDPEQEKEFDKGVLDAIDEGIENSGKTGTHLKSEPEKEPEKDPETPPIKESEKEPEKDPEKEPEKEPEKDPEKEPEKDPEKEPEKDSKPEKDPDPKIAAGEADPKGSPVPDGEAAPAAPKPDPRPSDEFGELEADAKPATKERFETMKTRFDETVTELGRVQQQNNDWMDTIKQTGATPEQLGASLSYLDDINKGTPESLERAYVTMQGEMNALAKVLGKEAPGYDPLDEYPELKARVKEGDIEHDDAVEIAGGRTRAAFSKKVESQPAPVFSLDDGYDELATLGNSLRASDNRYDEKLPFLKAIIEAAVSSGADPATWARTVKTAYEKMPKLAEKVVPKLPVTPNPIRPGGPGGSGTLDKEPGTAMEAMNQSLERGY